jgi:hypothetical protein
MKTQLHPIPNQYYGAARETEIDIGISVMGGEHKERAGYNFPLLFKMTRAPFTNLQTHISCDIHRSPILSNYPGQRHPTVSFKRKKIVPK